ncbi:tRNA lysidine(34) synthetase TilS [Maricaulis sp.]|uniref:tRNA lysidine(34) synthetase TilS n=1 Tax=Maricaulis sp. TaxID=1486257 RepID=UPI003A918C79
MTADPELVTRLHAWLDRVHPHTGPIALAYSGGGDSHALLSITAIWARARGIALHALTVDHALRPESRAEADQALESARRLGAEPVLLRWTGDKPATGLQAAARQARHVLLAEACRARKIDQLLLAHTLDDQAETVWMRLQAGGGWRGCAAMAERAASPVWPQGRGLELLRPLLDVRREALRTHLAAADERWIEDPSNTNPRYTRVRVRESLARLEQAGLSVDRLARWAHEIGAIERSERRAAAALAQDAVRLHPWGGAELDVERLAAAAPVIRRRLVDAVTLAISGRADTPRRSALDGLVDSLLRRRAGSAAGVQTLPWRGASWIIRDPGAVLGRVDRPGRKSFPLLQNSARVWDGRYEIETSSVNIIAEPLGKGYKGVGDRADLEAIPGLARSGLLTLRSSGEVLAIAGVRHHPQLGIMPLMAQRFHSRLRYDAAPKQGVGQLAPA